MRRYGPVYYLPGFISLCLLPLLFLLELRQRGVFKEYTMLKVFWNRSSDYGRNPFLTQHPARDFQKYFFTGDPVQDGHLLDQLEHTFKNILERQDTIRGIEIQFGPGCKYQIFISALDKLFAQKNWYSQSSEKGIKAWYQTPPDTSKAFSIEVLMLDCIMPNVEKERKNKAEQEALFRQSCLDLAMPLWPSVLLWMAMAVCSLRRSARKNVT